jgi:transposase
LKSAKDRMDIISAYQQVGSYRGAAELCNTTHRTVKKVVEKFEAGDAAPSRAERAHNYDAVAELVTERIAKSQGRMSAKRMLPIARAAGYEGSARNFRRLVAEAKLLWRNEHHRGRRPAVWSPGEYLVIDWAQAAPGLFLFCAVLAFSRWRFVAFATDQKASTTLALIAEAFGAIGGVPARVLADRMACLKGGVVANVVIPTAEYVRLASHYRFAPDFCHASDPESKGIVENLCGYAQRDLAVPLLTEAAITGLPVDLRAANAAARAWCAEVNALMHSEICAVPDERLIVERELLQPLPSLRLQLGAAVGDPQGRPTLVHSVRISPVLSTHPADRSHRSRGGRSRRSLPGRAHHRDDRRRTRTHRPRLSQPRSVVTAPPHTVRTEAVPVLTTGVSRNGVHAAAHRLLGDMRTTKR